MNKFDSKESYVKDLLCIISIFIIFFVITIGILFLASCQFVPEIAKDVDDIATDNAIKIEVSRETFSKDTDLNINVQVNNKDKEVN